MNKASCILGFSPGSRMRTWRSSRIVFNDCWQSDAIIVDLSCSSMYLVHTFHTWRCILLTLPSCHASLATFSSPCQVAMHHWQSQMCKTCSQCTVKYSPEQANYACATAYITKQCYLVPTKGSNALQSASGHASPTWWHKLKGHPATLWHLYPTRKGNLMQSIQVKKTQEKQTKNVKLKAQRDAVVNLPNPLHCVNRSIDARLDVRRLELGRHSNCFHQRRMTQFRHLQRVHDESTTTSHVCQIWDQSHHDSPNTIHATQLQYHHQ